MTTKIFKIKRIFPSVKNVKRKISFGIISIFVVGIFMLPLKGGIKINTDLSLAKIEITKTQALALATPAESWYYTSKNEKTGVSTKSTSYPSKAFCDAEKPASVAGTTTVSECQQDTSLAGSGITDLQLGCSLFKGLDGLYGCVAGLVWFGFRIVAYLGHFAAVFLDFFVYFSTNSSSYDNKFISTGWGMMRDLANMFFILALLYVAIKTILGLPGLDSKKMIGYIVIFALLINFSLFTTKVIIDSTNILAKIFYNNIPDVLNTSDKDVNGNPVEKTTMEGQKPISSMLMSTFNPQAILTQKEYNQDGGTTQFIFITLILIALILYTSYIFIAVSVLFVSRVATLWIQMIFSPIAFASYTIPYKIPGLGYEAWWDELLKNAFLAPVFIFFLFIVIKFSNIIKDIAAPQNAGDLFQKILATVVPFVIIFVLLMKAKKLAVEYSGDMGAAIMTGAKMVGGLALGAVTGGAAMLGTRGLGKMAASSLAKNEKTWAEQGEQKNLSGFAARMKLRTLSYGSKATYDARQTKLGTKMSSVTGMNFQTAGLVGLGSKEGGYKGMEKRKADKIMREFEPYKTKMTDPQVQEWSKKRTEEYNTKKEEALKNGTSEEEFNKTNTKPAEYFSAAQLNNARLKAYKENMGEGILGAGIYSSLEKIQPKIHERWEKKKEGARIEEKAKLKENFNEETFSDKYNEDHAEPAKTATKEGVRNVKLAIGGLAAAAVGIPGGATIANAIGMGGIGLVAGNKLMEKDAGETEAAKRIDKIIGQGKKLDAETEALNKRLESITNTRNKLADNFTELDKEARDVGKAKNEKEVEEYINKKYQKIKDEMEDTQDQANSLRQKRRAFESEIIENNSNSSLSPEDKNKLNTGLNEKIVAFQEKETELRENYTNNMVKDFGKIEMFKNKDQIEASLVRDESNARESLRKAAELANKNYSAPEKTHGTPIGEIIPKGDGGGGHAKEAHSKDAGHDAHPKAH